MKTLKRNGKLKLILAALIVLVLGIGLTVLLTNENIMAGTSAPACVNCGKTEYMTYVGSNYSNTDHIYSCSNCVDEDGYNIETWERHDYLTGAVSSVCRVCGHSCTHPIKNATPIDRGEDGHDITCSSCGAIVERLEHNESSYSKVDDEQHKITCICGYYTYGGHDKLTYSNFDNNKHKSTCVCGYYTYDDHVFQNGECISGCGAVECEHTYEEKYTDVNHWEECTKCGDTQNLRDHDIKYTKMANQHRKYCSICLFLVNEPHNYNAEGVCICGAIQTGGQEPGGETGGGTGGGATCSHTYAMKSDETNHWEECSKCNEKKSGSTEAHTEVSDAAVEATCKTEGKTEGKHCSVCNRVLVAQTTVAKLPHTEVVDAAVAATCKTEGKTEGKHCSVCNEVIVAQTTVAKLPHTEVVDAAVAATCKTEGKTEGKHCSVCNEVIVAQTTVAKLPHTEVIDAAVAATCKAEGKTEGKHCSVCNEVIVAQTTVAKLPHTEVIDPAVEATCEAEGKTEGKHCSVCNEVLVAQNIIEKKPHSYKDGVCEDCGAEQPVEECKHEETEMKNSATQHWEECKECGEKITETLEKHKYETYTPNEDGTHSSTCTVCNYELKAEHTYVDDECEDCGAEKPEEECEHDYDLEKNETHHWEECSKCNDKKGQEEHKYGEYTDNENGTHSTVCTVCGYKLTEEHKTDGNCPDCEYEEPEQKPDDDKNDDKNNVVDDTVVDKDIPHTGAGNIALITIFIIGLAGTISAVKMRKYKGL